jgi:hypothetical protein
MPPAVYFCRRPIPNATHSIFGFGGHNRPIPPSPLSTIAFTACTLPYALPPSHPPSALITGQYRMQCIRYLALGSKSPPTPDLSISTRHHRIPLTFSTLSAPTTSPAIDFHHGSVPNAAHSVLGCGVKIPAHVRSHHLDLPPPHPPRILQTICSHHVARH